MKYAVIQAHRGEFHLSLMCRAHIPAEAVRVARSLEYDGVLDKAYRKNLDGASTVWVTFSPAQSVSALSIPGAEVDLAQQAQERERRRPVGCKRATPMSR